VAQTTCPTLLVLWTRKREGVNAKLSSFCDVTQQPDKESSYDCMSMLLKIAANETLQNVSVILKNKKPSRNYLQSRNANTKQEAIFNFPKITKIKST
jgi:DNA primase